MTSTPTGHRPGILKQITLISRPGLSRRLLIYIIFCSSFFTLLSTGYQLYTEYQKDLLDIDDHMDFIRDSYLAPLAVHAYNMDHDQLNLLLAGVFNFRDIVYVEISEPSGTTRKTITTMGTLPETATICHEFTLRYPPSPDGAAPYATLLVAADQSRVYQRLWNKTLVILGSNAVKTLIAGIFIFLIIQYVVTRHLASMVTYIHGLHKDRPSPLLVLNGRNTRPSRKDELDQLTDAINHMRQTEARYRLLAENVTDVIWTMDMNRRFVYISQSVTQLLGYTAEEFMAGSMEKYLTPASFEEAMAVFNRGISLEQKKGKGFIKKSRTLELKHVHKNGTTFWTETKLSAIRDPEGNLSGVVGVTRNISRRRKAESRLRQAQKMEAIGSLAGGIAHDFNNILSAIIGYAQLARDKLPKDSPVQADIGQVYKAGERAKDLVMQILSFSRQQEQNAVPIRIGPIVKEALKFLKSSLPSSIEIRQEIIPDAGNVRADPTQIHQVFMNLCTNAAHAMDQTGGVLTIKLSSITLDQDDADTDPDLSPGKHLGLTVGDTEHGITPEILPKIFDPYFTTKKKGEGTGLGLATVHGIVRSYGGAITVYSEPGRGTTFHVYFPVIDNPAGSDPAPADPGDGAEDTAQKDTAILFVDDEPAIADLGKQLLESLGYRVKSLTDPVAALALVKKDPDRFDLAITDLTMPGMKGDRLAAELTKIRPDIPVILCSGFNAQLSEHAAAAAGIEAFIMKPILKKNLAQTIESVMTHPGES
ncbi:MAG: response regulator [Desulfotignum sp.]|nr:response regulator [Desulfotignum sp.]MCF8138691.1 response regulator [Desulfotignum sp.]